MSRLLFSAATLVIAVAVSGCAVMSEEDCYNADWSQLGYDDGVNGRPSSRFNEYVDACARYVNVNRSAYDSGRRQGADIFCTNDRAYQLGMENQEVSDICTVSSNYHNFKKYYTNGVNVYNECRPLYQTDEYLTSLNDYVSDFRLGALHSQLMADRDYLMLNRANLDNYCNYVKSNGYEGKFRRTDYSRFIDGMPYPAAIEAAADAEKMFEDVDRAYREIDRMIDEARRCEDRASDNDDRSERDRCRNRSRCLIRERERLSENEKKEVWNYSRNLNYTGTLYHSWIDDYRKCR